jgi:hypothetical protein
MMLPQPVQLIIDAADGDLDVAAMRIFEGPKATAIYVIRVGLEHMKSRHRAGRRRELRREVRPKFQAGKTHGSIELTPQSRKRLFGMTQELFGEDGWKIGEISLGNMTKESLLDQAGRERQSAHGHVRNAQFYEALAEPLRSGQCVHEYWNPETATKLKKAIWDRSKGKKAELVANAE